MDELTRAPARVTDARVEAMRQHGLTDESILPVNLITAYFNFVDRIALGLGVDVTVDEVQGYHY